MTYGGLNVPTWSLVNSIDCVNSEIYTASVVDNAVSPIGSPDFNIHSQLPTFTYFGNRTFVNASTASSVNYALIQGASGDTYVNGANSLTLRVDNATRLVLNSNNQHTLGGDLTINGGEIFSTKLICF